ncbi:MAG: hypothetical protein ABIS86_17400 [Streptosporangiaceae bacterium]
MPVGLQAFLSVAVLMGGIWTWGYFVQRREHRLPPGELAALLIQRRRHAWWRIPLTVSAPAVPLCLLSAATPRHEKASASASYLLCAVVGLVIGTLIVGIVYPPGGRD